MGRKVTNGRSIRWEKSLGTKKTRNVVVLRKERGGYLPSPGVLAPTPTRDDIVDGLPVFEQLVRGSKTRTGDRTEKGGQQGRSRS